MFPARMRRRVAVVVVEEYFLGKVRENRNGEIREKERDVVGTVWLLRTLEREWRWNWHCLSETSIADSTDIKERERE